MDSTKVVVSASRWLAYLLVAFGIGLFLLSGYLHLFSPWNEAEWASGAILNFATELLGAGTILLVVESNITKLQGEVEQRLAEERRQAEMEEEKRQLVRELASSDNTVAKNAARRLSDRGWLKDGVAAGANLKGANLQDAQLAFADLSNATLEGADLTDAVLTGSNLRGANLRGALMIGAQVDGTAFNELTTLPDGRLWGPGTSLKLLTGNGWLVTPRTVFGLSLARTIGDLDRNVRVLTVLQLVFGMLNFLSLISRLKTSRRPSK